jgi:hypothetical protein
MLFLFFAVLGFELRAYPLSHYTSPFLWWLFQDRVSWTISLGWFGTEILLISAFWIARITDVSHRYLAALFFFFSAGDQIQGSTYDKHTLYREMPPALFCVLVIGIILCRFLLDFTILLPKRIYHCIMLALVYKCTSFPLLYKYLGSNIIYFGYFNWFTLKVLIWIYLIDMHIYFLVEIFCPHFWMCKLFLNDREQNLNISFLYAWHMFSVYNKMFLLLKWKTA